MTTEIIIKNMQNNEETFFLEWYFLAKRVSGDDIKIFGHAKEHITLKGYEVKTFIKKSKGVSVINIQKLKKPYDGCIATKEMEVGFKSIDYIVLLKDNNQSIFKKDYYPRKFEKYTVK